MQAASSLKLNVTLPCEPRAIGDDECFTSAAGDGFHFEDRIPDPPPKEVGKGRRLAGAFGARGLVVAATPKWMLRPAEPIDAQRLARSAMRDSISRSIGQPSRCDRRFSPVGLS